MAIWYEVEKTENGIENFMKCNWDFHDFCPDRFSYYPPKQEIELFLKYDEPEGSIMLRFIGVRDFGFRIYGSKYDTIIMGAKTVLLNDGSLLWCSCEDFEDIKEIKQYSDWIKADKILWAVTNSLGVPAEMPKEKIDQVWNTWGIIEKKHFRLTEYTGDMK